MTTRKVSLTPGKRVLFLTKDPDLIRRQLTGELDLTMDDVSIEQLLDDVNTDVMTPAWTCFDHEPEQIARNAYAGLIVGGERLFREDALRDGNFEVIVSGYRKGTGSSRETAVQAEKWSGIRIAIAASFAPIHARNNICQGVLMADHAVLRRLQAGEAVSLETFMAGRDAVEREIIAAGGLFTYSQQLATGERQPPVLPARTPRPLTIAEKILERHLLASPGRGQLRPGDAVVVSVDSGYSHDYTSAQVHHFLREEYGPEYKVRNPARFAAFEDHLVYADEVPQLQAFAPKIERLRRLQREFQRHTGVRDYAATDGVSPGICHQVAREALIEPGDFIQATDSHTCMGGASNALAWGVGATEYAALLHSGMTAVTVPESIRFELHGRLASNVTAKDVMLHILATFARAQQTLGRVMEFGGPGLASLPVDERATLANMATECAARTGVFEADEALFDWLVERRPGGDVQAWRKHAVAPDAGAHYDGGVHRIELGAIEPMVATPGDPDRGIPSDPGNGERVAALGDIRIDIAYGGSCTAGKHADLDLYAQVVQRAVAAGRRVAPGVRFLIQYGSADVEACAHRKGYVALFERAGVRTIKPGCGACIGCGPGTSEQASQVT
ncbi:MAG TPA: aconitase family protein, partial [Steroidobacteraceae bacterium]|nr:aconitase family protein [Steroidobacteraceae bacterium]